jgi:hypothetical protein
VLRAWLWTYRYIDLELDGESWHVPMLPIRLGTFLRDTRHHPGTSPFPYHLPYASANPTSWPKSGVAAICSEVPIERSRQSERHQLSPGIAVCHYTCLVHRKLSPYHTPQDLELQTYTHQCLPHDEAREPRLTTSLQLHSFPPWATLTSIRTPSHSSFTSLVDVQLYTAPRALYHVHSLLRLLLVLKS